MIACSRVSSLRRLSSGGSPPGISFPEGHLQRLAPAVVAEGLEVQHLAAIADPALLGRERRTPGRSLTFIGRSGHLRCPAMLPGHVIRPALAAAGEVLAMGDQALV